MKNFFGYLARTVVSFVTVAAVAVGISAYLKHRDDASAERDQTGAVVDGGTVDAFSIEVGDCFQQPPAGDIASVKATPCSDPHDYEAYHVFNMVGDIYPGPTEINSQAEAGCVPTAAAYVGPSFDPAIYAITWINPSSSTWTAVGDREVVCTLSHADGTPLAGSLSSSAP